MTEAKKEEDAAAPMPAPGKRFTQFKPKGARTIHIHVVLPDGYKEVFDTGTATPAKANGKARSRLSALCRERNIPTAASVLRANGGTTSYDRTKLNNEAKANGQPVPFPTGSKGRQMMLGSGLARGPDPIEAEDLGWTSFVKTYEQRCVQFFLRVTELMLLGSADNPQTFVNHIKATVVETIQGARKAKLGRPSKD